LTTLQTGGGGIALASYRSTAKELLAEAAERPSYKSPALAKSGLERGTPLGI
jgi:hypothetical protein